MSLTYSTDPALGQNYPVTAEIGAQYRLKGVDDHEIDLAQFASGDLKALLIMFICNHCPYVMAIEDRLVSLGKAFLKNADAASGKIRMVAISSNDVERYPADSLAQMKKKAAEKNYPFPYLIDETQTIAKTFGAVCTPDFFLYDQQLKLVYRGRLDDSWKDPEQVRKQDLKTAIERLRDGQSVDPEQKPSMGCSIKWK